MKKLIVLMAVLFALSCSASVLAASPNCFDGSCSTPRIMLAAGPGPDSYSVAPPGAMRYDKAKKPPPDARNINHDAKRNSNGPSSNGNVVCWKKARDLPGGGIELRLANPIKGNYQVFAKKAELCKLAWREEYERNYKAKYRVGLVMGFSEEDPQMYQDSPVIRLMPRR